MPDDPYRKVGFRVARDVPTWGGKTIYCYERLLQQVRIGEVRGDRYGGGLWQHISILDGAEPIPNEQVARWTRTSDLDWLALKLRTS